MSWTSIPAKEYCDSVRDGTHDTPKPTDDGYKLVTGKHIKNGCIDSTDAYYISEDDYRKINERSLVEKWDVLMSMIGTVGEVAVVRETPDYAIKNIALFKCGGSEIKGKWLSYYLQSPMAKAHFSGNQKGSSQQFLSLKQLREMPVIVTDEAQMEKVVAILSSYDELIENNQKQIKLLEEATERLYKEWFVDLRFPGHENTPIVDGVPEGWSKKSMDELAEYLNGYAFKPSDWGTAGKPIIKIKELNEGVTKDTPRNAGNSIPPKYIVAPGDILFSWSATLTAKIWDSEKGLLNQHLFKVIPSEGVCREFVLQSILMTLDEFKNLTTGSTMKHIQRGKLKDVFVCVPSLEIMKKYSEQGDTIRERILVLNRKIQLLSETRDILLPKLMSGKIEV